MATTDDTSCEGAAAPGLQPLANDPSHQQPGASPTLAVQQMHLERLEEELAGRLRQVADQIVGELVSNRDSRLTSQIAGLGE
ncbi:MAG TPA: hypothetical protein VHV08_07805, partial [Pirellulales bacterium]|nr:hypothetical protein [Pirellulales bacterium]